MRILYAEDEKQLSSAVTEILKMEGFEAVPVYDGQEAWERLSAERFDAVILDVMMPKMDGIEVLKRMRADGDYTPVLMLTAKATVNDRVAGITEGADDYLSKPFAMRELVARVNSLIRRAAGYRRGTLTAANITLDLGSGELSSDKGSLRLNNLEAEMLAHFIRNMGVFYTPEEVNRVIFAGKESPEKAELYMYYLKNKLTQIRSRVVIVIREDAFALGEADE